MALVGDVIVQAREAFPDPCQTINGAPTGFTATAVVNGSGVVTAGTYYLQFTLLNPWGETLPSAEISVIVGGGGTNAIQVTAPTTPPYLPTAVGAISFRVYVGTTPGGENFCIQSYGIGQITIINLFSPTAVSASGVQVNGTFAQPPLRSSAWLPDSDGGFVSASTLYRWLNDGLQKMGRIAGGIPGMTGVQAAAGQSMYRIPGRWIRLTNGWFDGWPLTFGKRGDVFLHNLVSGISGIVTVEEWTDSTIVQAWPQPNRTGAVSNLAAVAGITDGNLSVTNVGSFLPMGLGILFGIPASYAGVSFNTNQLQTELFAYTGTNATSNPQLLQNCVRGVGGTQVLGWPSLSTGVFEANLRFAGFRQPNTYTLGQSFASLGLPLGWEVPLSDYILAQYKKAEQDVQASAAIEKGFTEDVSALAKLARGKSHPIQIGSITREVYPGGFGGGILIP